MRGSGGYNATLGVDIGTGQGLGWVRGSGLGVSEGGRYRLEKLNYLVRGVEVV